MLRVLIVDDEPPARRRLKGLLKDEGDITVVGECEDGESAVAAVRRLAPDLVLLDVQMPGMDGFEVIDAIIRTIGPSRCPAIVFVTAHDKYALKAFDVHASDYLLKPFDRTRLRQALARVRALALSPDDLTRTLLGLVRDVRAGRPLERFVVRSRGRVYFIRAGEVDWIEAHGHYLTLHVGRDTHLIRETIRHLESRLDANRFIRVQRSAIINVDRIKELLPTFHGEYVVVLRDGTRVSSGRGYSHRLQTLARGQA